MKALVIGGSLSGLFTANLLRTIGWHVDVFERTRDDLSGRGAGLGARADLFAVMRRVGIPIDESIWVEVRSHTCLDRSGKIVCQVPVREVNTAWDRIYRALKQAWPAAHYYAGRTLTRLEQDEHRVTAVFADGLRAEADLLIGADGIRSTVRRQLLPEVAPRYAGYVAWRGVVEDGQIETHWRGMALHHMVFCLSDGELAFSVPMAAPDDTRCVRRCMFVWFRPADASALRDLCTDAAGRCHGDSIPPPLIRPELVTDLKATAHTLLAPQIAELVGNARDPILSTIFDLETPRMAFGRVALVGDAAFVARPHVGTGVTKAALDAQALADALSAAGRDLGSALADYESTRKPIGRQMVARGRYLGSHLEPRHLRTDGIGPSRRPPLETYLREYGAGSVADWPSNRPEGLGT
jgi:2-polyprenyl-6-methoxyphenol hydroxylase-like FAD-dependent oxidoreductase